MAPPRKDWRCHTCGRNQAELQLDSSLKAPHQALCKGLGVDGEPLGIYNKCMDRTCQDYLRDKAFVSLDALRKHYSRKHSINLHEYTGLHHLRAKLQPDGIPTTDMNANFGAFYSQTTTSTSTTATATATAVSSLTVSTVLTPPPLSQYLQDLQDLDITFPVQAAAKLPGLLRTYRAEFREYFGGAFPLTFHSHVSDVTPYRITATILDLIKMCPRGQGQGRKGQGGAVALSKKQRETCALAVLDGSYGGSFGPLSASVPSHRDNACGPKPISFPASEGYDYMALCRKLANKSYVGILVDIVAANGNVLSPTIWKSLCRACEETGLYLVVDEAMTAIRCGAPLACLRDEYCAFRPSFVLFGKGLRVSGLAAFTDGVSMRHMGYHDAADNTIEDAASGCLDLSHSEVVSVASLTASFAVIVRARDEGWIQRSRAIGTTLRRFIRESYNNKANDDSKRDKDGGCCDRGLESLIYLPRHIADGAGIIGAATGNGWTRWIPYLDRGMLDAEQVQALFPGGPATQSLRSDLYSATRSRSDICAVCHDFEVPGQDAVACKTCYAPLCSYCLEGRAPPVLQHLGGQCLAGW